MRATLRAMQMRCRHLAKAAIPCALDWGHEEEIWKEIGLCTACPGTEGKHKFSCVVGGARGLELPADVAADGTVTVTKGARR